jgi:hypothetical protein
MAHKPTPIEAGDQSTKKSAKDAVEQRIARSSDLTKGSTVKERHATDADLVRQEARTQKSFGRGAITFRNDLAPRNVERLSKEQYREVQAITRQDVSDPERLTKRRLKAYERKFQGQLAENALAEMGGTSLNDAKGNFPVYDHLFRGETASVKTHMPNPEHENQHLAAYAHDLRVAIGATDAKRGKYAGKDGPSFAADQLKGFANTDVDFTHASKSEIHRYLVDTATLRIPSSHVKDVQAYVRRCAAQEPELYGLPSHYKDSDENRLVERIKPAPLTERQIRQAVEARMAELGSK